MTFRIKLRGDPTGTIQHEYLCPVHGRFTAEVSRADVPDSVECPEIGPGAERRGDDWIAVTCGMNSPWSPGRIMSRVNQCQVVQGKVGEYPGEEYVMDTRPLADGMPLHEFKARRAKVHRDIALRKMRQLAGRGPKVYR